MAESDFLVVLNYSGQTMAAEDLVVLYEEVLDHIVGVSVARVEA